MAKPPKVKRHRPRVRRVILFNTYFEYFEYTYTYFNIHFYLYVYKNIQNTLLKRNGLEHANLSFPKQIEKSRSMNPLTL